MSEEIKLDDQKYLKAESNLLSSLRFYKKLLLIKILLFIPYALVMVFVFLAIYKSQFVYIAPIMICSIWAIIHTCFILLRVNPSIRSTAKFLTKYKSEMSEFYQSSKLNWFNRIIFKHFFLVDMYGKREPNIIIKYPEKYTEIEKTGEIPYHVREANLDSQAGNFETIMRASSEKD
ncbi:hypothetical protein [Mycoplasma sp. 2634B]|uniref:hypothetical protein n=1 Tax=Mycoplasma sp. 2634B TaxID=3401692 RepID=UPI003AAC8339